MNSCQEIAKIIAKFKAENWNEAITAANKTDLTDQYILVWMGYCHYKGYTAEIGNFLQMNPGLKSRFTRFIEFPDYSADELAEIFVWMASAELFSFDEDVAAIVQRKMGSLVESKSTSFGNARAVRTFYEKVKGRQAVRLAKLDRPSRAQMTELLPEDVYIDMDEGL